MTESKPQPTHPDPFGWRDPGTLIDGDLELILVECIPAVPEKGHVPCYHFEMRHPGEAERLGSIRLRVGRAELMDRVNGQIGYRVEPAHRGHHYAARSCRLLYSLARAHGLDPLWITCDPDNWASRRTCELAGAVYVETLDVPKDTDEYREGERQKRRYRVDLSADT